MRELAKRPPRDRRDLFRAAAQTMGVHEAVVEKDFWVCWALDYLFSDCPWKDSLAFKGGTSLSKAFGAIERFSEDIDLILDWRVLGYDSETPWEARSHTKQDAFCKESNKKTEAFLAEAFAPRIAPDLSDRAGREMAVVVSGQNVLIHYPKAFSLLAIQPQIRLEIGPMAQWVPNEEKDIRPYAAETHPSLFRQPSTRVRTILAERTFWEKATILHQEAHRKSDQPMPLRYSRHYYDLYRLSLSPIREAALARRDLLGDVVAFKTRFYRCPWAKYENARSGGLRLLPPEWRRKELLKDYQDMRAMLFGRIPAFDEIIVGLGALEKTINEQEATEP
jgi:hypothetical protein